VKLIFLTSSKIKERNNIINNNIDILDKVFKESSKRFLFMLNREANIFDKEDLYQELFIYLFNKIDSSLSENKKSSLLASLEEKDMKYLYSSCRNWSIDISRKYSERRRKVSEEDDYVRIYIDDLREEVFSYDGRDMSILFDIVQQYIDKLTPEYLGITEEELDILKEYFFEDLSQEEIAEIHDVYQQKISRTIRKLKQVAIPKIKTDIELLVELHGE